MASAGADNTARLWNGENGAPLKTLTVGSVAYAIAISPDGKQIAAGSFDGFVRLYDATSARLLLSLVALPNAEQPAWWAITPEGYFDRGGEPTQKAQWRANGQAAPEALWKPLEDANLVAKACRGETLPAPQVDAKK